MKPATLARRRRQRQAEQAADRRYHQAWLVRVIREKHEPVDIWVEMLKEHRAKYGDLLQPKPRHEF